MYIFVFLYLTSSDTVLHTVLVSVRPPPSPPHTHKHVLFFLFSFSNLDPSLSKFTRELKIRVKGVLKNLLTYIEMLIVCDCMNRVLAAEKHKNYRQRC